MGQSAIAHALAAIKAGQPTISETIGQIGAKLGYEEIPGEVSQNAKKFILDLLSCILGAKEISSSQIMAETVFELGGKPDSTVLGYGVKTSPMLAALANGTIGHAFDMDDTHREGTLHCSVVVFPAVLAMAEKLGVDGKALLTAFIFGSEVTVRAGAAFVGRTYFQGFHPTGTCGVFGAAAGVSKLLGLGGDKIALALGLAGSQAGGLLEWKAQGTWSKRLQAGHPSMCGVLSALLAQRGYTSPSTVFEGEDGFIRAYSHKDQFDLTRLTDAFGQKWEMAGTSIKVHACCRFSAPLADCALDLRNQGVTADQVEEILATGSKYTLKVLCDPPERKYKPQNTVDAQFSLPYAVACGIVKGRESIFEFTDEAIKDPEVIKLASKVKWDLDPKAEEVYPKLWPATVIVKTKNGRTYTSHIDFPKGDPENEVPFREVEEKFRLLAGQTIGKDKIERVIDYCTNLEKLDNVNKLISCLY
jgi:2-methylcitrate dehydratase PrpD